MWYCGQGKASRSPPFCPLAPEVSSHLICAPAPLQIQRRVGRSSVLANINLTHSLWLQKLENLYQNYPQKTRKKPAKSVKNPQIPKSRWAAFPKALCAYSIRLDSARDQKEMVQYLVFDVQSGYLQKRLLQPLRCDWSRVPWNFIFLWESSGSGQYQSLALKSPDVPYWRGVNTSYLGRRFGTCWWYGCPVLLCRFNGMRPWSADSGALDASSHCGSLYWILDNPTYI